MIPWEGGRGRRPQRLPLLEPSSRCPGLARDGPWPMRLSPEPPTPKQRQGGRQGSASLSRWAVTSLDDQQVLFWGRPASCPLAPGSVPPPVLSRGLPHISTTKLPLVPKSIQHVFCCAQPENPDRPQQEGPSRRWEDVSGPQSPCGLPSSEGTVEVAPHLQQHHPRRIRLIGPPVEAGNKGEREERSLPELRVGPGVRGSRRSV